jgi:hypothetical protein
VSNTKFSRTNVLRLDDAEQQALARAVMGEIERHSHSFNAPGGGTEPEKRYLRTLRSLLERLTAK